jgi:predicted transcriptional regulator
MEDYIDQILSSMVSDEIFSLIREDFFIYFKKLSQKIQILYLFSLEKELSNKEIEIYFPNYNVRVYTQRLDNNGFVIVNSKQGREYNYIISDKGIEYISRLNKKFLTNNYEYIEWIQKKRQNKIENTSTNDSAKIIWNALSVANIKPNVHNQVLIDMKKLSEWSIEATDIIYSNFKEAINWIIHYYSDDIDNISSNNIRVCNVHETEYRNIQSILLSFKKKNKKMP